ncbi:PAS domain S-box protein [Desulfosporosinus fructosivorans]|uniref:histidine kinase n=1 Tax=Desulfosporosinus fructosivorans TaxID=2018669 RepID=A0A4Z0R1G6_9FIRM|nr:histidine kinase N-terminal 7TM domain-containing protein [Desulfosporosinus fructosivorans]TGE36580.1 PAS domain S-box protein [Desulfosporosinus fructosivorans]
MKYQYIPYIWPLIVSAFCSLSLGLYALLKRRNAKGAKSFILSMFVVTIWSSANALEMSGANLTTKLFWANMQYFAYCYSPVTLLALCMQFTGYDQWIRNRKVLWIAVIPTIIVLLVWTDGWHGLIRYDVHMDYSGSFPVIAKEYGPVFYIHAGYSHLLNITAWVLLIRAVFFKNTVYRRQAIALFFGVSLIIVPNIMYIFGFSPVKRLDITPIFFGPAGLIIAWGIFHLKLFDLVPLARATVIETMDAGVMVLDLQDRVLDINPAFEMIVGYTADRISTKTVKEVCAKIPELARTCIDRRFTHREFSINLDGFSKVYEVLISPLSDSKGILIGRLAVIYDITERKQAQQEFLNQQRKLAVIEERESLARDMHDNLGQVLGFINLQAQGIRQELFNAGVETAAARFDKLVDATQSAHQEIREYIKNARSSASSEKNFSTALTKDIMIFENQTGLKVELKIPNGFTGEELEPNIRLNLLNIVKEALNNIRKHAEAEQVKIIVSLAKKQLIVTIEDDGKGFDKAEQNYGTKTKFGLDIMRERASKIGLKIDIQSSVGKGTRINCMLFKEERKNTDEIDAG